MPRDLILYLSIIALAAFATGVQLVMIPWLATGYLHLPAQQVGWVQAAQLLPGALLLLWSGAVADRSSSIRLLPMAYLMLMACHLAGLVVTSFNWLVLPLLLVYAVMLGVTYAMIQPLRDRLLPQVVVGPGERGVQQGVVLASMCVYVGQALGVGFAGQMERLGPPSLFLSQSAVLLVVMLLSRSLVRRLASRVVHSGLQKTPQPTVTQGLRYIRQHEVLRHLVSLVAFNGFINLGVFLVALPLLVRDIYRQDAAFFSGLQLVFVCGNIAATLGLLRRGRVEEPGRSMLFCLLYTALIMLAMSARPTSTGLLLLVFAWGAVAGVSTSMGKSLMQQQVDECYRGRVLSLYFLALLGAAPLGALACGYFMHSFGALALLQSGGVISLGLFAVYLTIPALWRVSPG